jgi:hypothetical protein
MRNESKWAILILIMSGFFGAFFIAPLIGTKALIGAFIGMVGCVYLLPFLLRDPYGLEAAKTMEIGIWNSFLHPTNLPITLAIIWVLFIAGVSSFLEFKTSEFKLGLNLSDILFLPFLLLMGLSGFQMIRRNESVSKVGYVYKGFWAYLNGAVCILFGWGGFLFFMFTWIFHW